VFFARAILRVRLASYKLIKGVLLPRGDPHFTKL
jgi:hypothetical protein